MLQINQIQHLLREDASFLDFSTPKILPDEKTVTDREATD